ncbi:MAG: tetratricopeptide repeat-containing glycosyltransferase family protein, partial [Phenylobacterium sp.]
HRALQRALAEDHLAQAVGGLAERVGVHGRAHEFAQALDLALGAPDDANALNVAAAAAAGLGRRAEAEQLYRQALSLDPDNPTTHNNLGLFLREAGRDAESESILLAGLERAPDMVELRHCLAGLYRLQGRLDLAEAQYRALLARRPELLETRFRLAGLLLALGRFEEGWALYECRHHPGRAEAPALPDFGCPAWEGQPLAGKSLLIWFEQGYGDEIQFGRYVPLLKAMGAAHITLFCRPALEPLLRSLAGVDLLVPASGSQNTPDHDYWTLPMSIPHWVDTRLDTIPAETPYLSAPPERRPAWAGRLPAGRRVGLAWRGNPAFAADALRSLPGLASLRALWDAPGLSFVSLQKGAGEAEAQAPPPGQPILDLGSQARDFADSAAIIEQLDLVISVDSAPAHLAGALGRPVWLLLPWESLDARWLLERDDSPWYPTMRLFRQARGEGWGPVIARLAEALKGWASRASPA